MSIDDLKHSTKVFVNGEWIGLHFEPVKLYSQLKEAKRNGILHVHTGLVWNIPSES